jgi:hypothetical protein
MAMALDTDPHARLRDWIAFVALMAFLIGALAWLLASV